MLDLIIEQSNKTEIVEADDNLQKKKSITTPVNYQYITVLEFHL
jgi:hypothetical protein